MSELQPTTQFVEDFFNTTMFFCCAWIIVFLLFCWLLKILYQFLSKKTGLLFEKIGRLDGAQKQKVSRLVFLCSFLFLLMQISGGLWIGILRRRGDCTILGVNFGYGFGVVQAIVTCAFVLCSIKLIHIFHKAYCKNASNNRRPIHVFVNILYVVLCTIGAFSIMSMITKERPIILMSTFGAAFAIFVFAFKDFLSSVTANLQLNVEKIVKVGDWIVVSPYHVDGIVEAISARTILVRNWDMSLASFPIKKLMDETFFSYSAMQEAKARQIRRALIIDQKSVRFLTQEEIKALKESHLLTDEILDRAKTFDDTSELATSRLWTNLELFGLYTEDYLGRRKDIRHDKDCMMRTLDPTGTGIPMEIYCYCTVTSLVEFEERQRGVVCHLLAVLPLFHLRISQINTIRMDEDHDTRVIHRDVCPDK